MKKCALVNRWDNFSKDFEERNNYVVGIRDILNVKNTLVKNRELGSLLELGCGNGTYTECFLSSARSWQQMFQSVWLLLQKQSILLKR